MLQFHNIGLPLTWKYFDSARGNTDFILTRHPNKSILIKEMSLFSHFFKTILQKRAAFSDLSIYKSEQSSVHADHSCLYWLKLYLSLTVWPILAFSFQDLLKKKTTSYSEISLHSQKDATTVQRGLLHPATNFSQGFHLT